VNNLGVSTEKYEFVDIYGLENELLAMVPRPVLAVLLLFPITKEVSSLLITIRFTTFLQAYHLSQSKYEEYQEKLSQEIKLKGQKISSNLYFTKQTIRNACGTVGIIHSLANNSKALEIEGKF